MTPAQESQVLKVLIETLSNSRKQTALLTDVRAELADVRRELAQLKGTN